MFFFALIPLGKKSSRKIALPFFLLVQLPTAEVPLK